MTTDRDLVNRVRTGDYQAYASLVERYERSVLAVVQAELRDPVKAQTVARATLVRGFRRIEKLQDGSSFGPWILKMARRRSIDAVRRMPVAIGASIHCGGPGIVFGGAELDWIEHEHVLELVARLPEEERRLVGMRYFDNFDLSEIANAVERPSHEVARQLSRAMMRLQYWWTREQDL